MTGKDTFKSTEVPEPVSSIEDFDGLCISRSKGHYGTAGE